MTFSPEQARDETRADPKAAPLAYVTAMFAVVFAITIVGLQAYFGRTVEDERQVKVLAARSEALSRVRAEQQARLSGYRWVSPDSGVVAVPIERAMEVVAAELAARASAGAEPAAPSAAAGPAAAGR